MVNGDKRITIEMLLRDNLTQKAKQISKTMGGLAKSVKGPKSISEAIEQTKFTNLNTQLKALGNVSDKIRIPMKQLSVAGMGFRNVMQMSLGTLKQVNEQGLQKGFTRAGKFAFGLRRLTHGMRGFRMEMLGVMFFGMGVQKFFTGLLKPALQLTGFMELLSMTLAIVFLPVALMLLDLLLPLFMWFMNLSEATKLLIGKMVLWGAIIGGALFIIGMFALGIGSLILAFGGLLGIIERLFPEPLGDFAAAFIGINAAMLGGKFVVGIWNKIKDVVVGLWNKLKESDKIKELLDDLGISIGFLEEPWETIKEKAKEFMDSMGIDVPAIKEDVDDFVETMKELLEVIKDLAKSDLFKILDKIAGVSLKAAEVTAKVIAIPPEERPTPVSRYGEEGAPFSFSALIDAIKEGFMGVNINVTSNGYEASVRGTGGTE